MEIDVQSLGTFNRLAKEGAEHAAGSLSQLTDIETHVTVTNVSLMDRTDIEEEFAGGEFVGVQIGFEGALTGETVLVFDRPGARRIVDTLVPEAGEGIEGIARSGVEEVGNIMTSGFIDGWADHLGARIDITTPTFVERSGADVLPEGTLAGDHVIAFKSRIETVEDELDFQIYMLPEYETFAAAMAEGDGGETIPVDKLSTFNRMTKDGARKAADNVTTMTGIEADVTLSRLCFVPIEDIQTQVGDAEYAGGVLEFEGPPSGYMAILFAPESARDVARTLLPAEPEDEGFGEMERSAIQELTNIMTSGFIDGWANVLETGIEHSPPEFVHDMGSSIVSPIAGRLGRTQEHAFVIDSAIETDGRAFECNIYALPDEAELGEALAALDVERADRTEADPEQFL